MLLDLLSEYLNKVEAIVLMLHIFLILQIFHITSIYRIKLLTLQKFQYLM